LALTTQIGLLGVLMAVLCPVCHLHYFVLLLPVVMALLVRHDQHPSARSAAWLIGLSWAFVLALSLPMVPALGVLRDVGVPLLGAMGLLLRALLLRWDDTTGVTERLDGGLVEPSSLCPRPLHGSDTCLRLLP